MPRADRQRPGAARPSPARNQTDAWATRGSVSSQQPSCQRHIDMTLRDFLRRGWQVPGEPMRVHRPRRVSRVLSVSPD